MISILIKLTAAERIVSLIERVQRGSCPLVFPILTKDSKAMRRFLKANGVSCVRFWSDFHRTLPQQQFPYETMLKQSIVAIPIHQNLSRDDIEYIAAILKKWSKGT